MRRRCPYFSISFLENSSYSLFFRTLFFYIASDNELNVLRDKFSGGKLF